MYYFYARAIADQVVSLVPPQIPEDITKKVLPYIQDEFAKLNTKLKMKVEFLGGGNPWVADTDHWNYEAAQRATEVCK